MQRIKISLTVILLLLSSLLILRGNSKDSLIFVEAQWIKKKIVPGVTLIQKHFKDSSLFNSNQYISILELEIDSDLHFGILADTVLRRTSDFAGEADAVAAINGSFFAYKNPYNSVDYLRIGRVELAPNNFGKSFWRLMHQQGAIAILKGKPYILKADEAKDWERYIYADDILTSGPILITDRTRENLRKDKFYTTRHPRTAVAKKGDKIFYLITVDGRSKESYGVTLEELQNILYWLGADMALNLDGGGSTTMYVKGEEEKGVVNYPTDNKTWDHNGERRVANTLVVKSTK